MHGDVLLNGPVYLVLAAIVVLAAGLAAFVLVDVFRPRRREALARVPEPGWAYAALEGAFLVALMAGQFASAPDWVRTTSVGLLPFAVAVAVAYLLRVVYPKPVARGDAPSADRDGGEGADRGAEG
ncbi:MAG: hypothetical protein FDZ70_05730 [Actinobacteria bacterium]|nr:MAG: hypothetical protein FDZ70_05730 [Actinomycetota bacterium]